MLEPTGLVWLPIAMFLRDHCPQVILVRAKEPKVAALRRVLREHAKSDRIDALTLARLLNEDGWQVAVSMVGRILKRLRDRGILKEPICNSISVRKRLRQRPYATRKPKEYEAIEPGDIVQLDTMDVRPLPGVIIKHFAARDVVSRWDVLEAHNRATSAAATGFIHSLLARMPFPIRAIDQPPIIVPLPKLELPTWIYDPSLCSITESFWSTG